MVTAEQGKKIANAAKSWLGTPHINNARVKGKGVDCAQLLVGSLEDCGIIRENEITVPPYPNEWHLHRSEEKLLQQVQARCREVSLATIQPGDFLLYQYGRCVSHAAVYCGNGVVCHALIDQGVILSEIDDVMFYDARGKSRLRGIYRYNGGA